MTNFALVGPSGEISLLSTNFPFVGPAEEIGLLSLPGGRDEFLQLAERQQLVPRLFRERARPAIIVQAFQLVAPGELSGWRLAKHVWVLLEGRTICAAGAGEVFESLYAEVTTRPLWSEKTIDTQAR